MATLTFLPGIIQQMNITTPAELTAGLQGAADALNEALIQSGASLPTIDDENPPVQDSIFVVTESEDEMVLDGVYAFDGEGWVLILGNPSATLANLQTQITTVSEDLAASEVDYVTELPAAADSITNQVLFRGPAEGTRAFDVGFWRFTGSGWQRILSAGLVQRNETRIRNNQAQTQTIRNVTDARFQAALDLYMLNDSNLRQLVDTNFELTETNQTNIATNASNISQNVTLINNVNGALNDARADIMGNTNLIEALQSEVTTLSQSLTTAQAAIVALQQQVSDLTIPTRNDENFSQWVRTNSIAWDWEPTVGRENTETWPILDISFLDRLQEVLPYTNYSPDDFPGEAGNRYFEVTNGVITAIPQENGTTLFRPYAFVDNDVSQIMVNVPFGITYGDVATAIGALNSRIQTTGGRYVIGG